MIGDANNNNNSVDERIKQITITENTKEGQTSVIKLETIDSNKEIVPNPGSNIGSNSLSVNQEKAEKKESLRIVDMTMPKDWKLPADKARREAADKARREAADKARREAEEKVRREAEEIQYTTTKESIEPPQQQTIIQKDLTRPKENYLDPFADNLTLWQYSAIAWIDMYKEFAINAAKLSEHWFNLFWSPWTKEQRKDKVKIE